MFLWGSVRGFDGVTKFYAVEKELTREVYVAVVQNGKIKAMIDDTEDKDFEFEIFQLQEYGVDYVEVYKELEKFAVTGNFTFDKSVKR